MTYGIKWSRDRGRHVTLKRQTRDFNTLREPNISKTAGHTI